MSANLQHGVPAPVGPPDLARALEPLAALAGDVYGFQELDRGMSRSARVLQPELLADHLDGELLWAPAVTRGGGRYGIALVVRGQVLDHASVDLPGAGEPRRVLVAEVETDGRRWTVATTHLSNKGRFARQQLPACFDALAGRPSPRVLVGDLNLRPHEVLPHASAEGYHLLAGAATFDARTAPSRRIDHLLVRGAHIGRSGTAQLPVSDHLAIWADLR